MSRKASIGLGVLLLALCSSLATIAVAQTGKPAPAGPPLEIQLKEPIKYGENCRRLKDSRYGVFKRDACGRTYCGLVEVKDIIEVRPNFAAEHACSWQLDGAACKCLKASRP